MVIDSATIDADGLGLVVYRNGVNRRYTDFFTTALDYLGNGEF